MSGRHRPTALMRTDDTVAPGVRRIRAPWLVGLGLAVVVVGIVVIALTLSRGVENAQQDASLSQDETRQLREFLADRGKQRDTERAEVQEQLDDQRAVLCAAISTLSTAARPQARTVLAKAAKDLNCAALPAATRTTSPTDRSTPRPSTPGTAAPVGTSSPRSASAGAPAARSTPRSSTPSPRPKPAPSTPSPTSSPSPKPTLTPPPRLLDPVTAPVCDLLGICL